MFKDRRDAGIRLAQALDHYRQAEPIIFALPRGGVVLGVEIAKRLHAPLDLVITKKIGHPMNPEYAIGAMAEEGEPVCNAREVEKIDPIWFEEEKDKIRLEIKRRRNKYLGKEKPRSLEGKTAILVDDGIATGFTMMAAINEIKTRNPNKIVVAIPVTPFDIAQELIKVTDELVSLEVDEDYLGAVGAYYQYFDQVQDEEVLALLKSAGNETPVNMEE